MLEEFDHACAAVELTLRRWVKVGAELRERFEFTVRGKVKTQRAGDFLHRLDLRVTTDARHRNTDVDGGTNTGREEFRLEVDLAVGDRDDVRRDVCRHVAFLRFDDRERGERSAAVLVRELGCALEETGVQVEDVTGVRFAAWRTTEEKRKFAVRDGLLRKVVVDAEDVLRRLAFLTLPHEVLAHRATGVRSDVLERRSGRRACDDDDRVVERAVLAERFDDAGDGRVLLADRDVDAHDRVGRTPVLLLIDDGVEADGGLAGLTVADHEFALTTTDGNHRVNSLDAELERFLDGLTRSDARSNDVELLTTRCVDRWATVDRVAEWIDDAAEELWTNRHFEEIARRARGCAFANRGRVAVKHAAHGVEFEVHHLTHDLASGALELDELASHRLREAVHAGNTVTDFDHLADFRDLEFARVLLDFLANDCRDLVALDLHGWVLVVVFSVVGAGPIV